jgi:hypothetical protein
MKITQENIQSAIQELWREEKCPILNGVIYGTGKTVSMYLPSVPREVNVLLDLKEIERGEIDSFLKKKPDFATSITQLGESFSNSNDLRASCGEGSFGADGYVALSSINDDRLIWIIFFDDSNPFIEVIFSGANIKALTTLDTEWTIPIDTPERMVVISGNPKG